MIGRLTRRRWLITGVAGWIVLVGWLAVWSVNHDPPTVPEQRTIAEALPELRRATGVVYAAAAGAQRAAVLGDIEFTSGCRLTSVRDGVLAVREVTVFGQIGSERADLAAIIAGLPASYRGEVTAGQGGTRFGLHADAGNFIGIDADGKVGDPSLVLRLSTDCRPGVAPSPDQGEPLAGAAPDALGAALRGLGVSAPVSAAAVEAQTTRCPSGTIAGTYLVDGVPAPAQQPHVEGLIRSDHDGWAYRVGVDSVVVRRDGTHLRIAVSTPC